MKKQILIILGILLVLAPMVSAATTMQEPLDLYHLFVENVFGNILFAGAGLAAFFVLIMILGKCSPLTITYIIGLFVLVYGIGTFGAFVGVPVFLYSIYVFISGITKFVDKRS